MSPSPPPDTLTLFGPILTDGVQLPPSRVRVEGGRIAAIERGATSAGADLVVEDGWIVPGLVDLQVNGAAGVDLTSDPDPREALRRVARTLAERGVTSFCPTVVSSPLPAVLERLRAYGPSATPGCAESLGVHVEGPFIDPDHRGVHEPAALRPPSLAEADEWLAAGPPSIVTLAPELPGAIEVIRALARAGVLVSLGHSGATVEAGRTGLEAGARMGTHLFNAMPPLHHRRPGLVGALLADAPAVGLIADGVHLDPLIVDLVIRAAGVERVVLVSDALAAAGAPPGPVALGGQTVVSDGRVVRRADGTLAGSALLLDDGVRNARHWLGWLDPARLIRMATQTPAEALGPRHAARKGRIAVGYDADLVAIDGGWRVTATVVRGALVRPPLDTEDAA